MFTVHFQRLPAKWISFSLRVGIKVPASEKGNTVLRLDTSEWPKLLSSIRNSDYPKKKKKKSLTFQAKWTFLEANKKISLVRKESQIRDLRAPHTIWENKVKSAARENMV